MKGNKLMKGIIILVVLILIVGIVYLVYRYKNKTHQIIKNPYEIELTLEKTAGIPFTYDYEIEDPEILKLDRNYVLKDENKNGLVGGHIYVNYVFKGLKEGKTKVRFKRTYIDDKNDVDILGEYTIIVDKDLKPALENKKGE